MPNSRSRRGRKVTADRVVLRLGELDASILQRLQQAAGTQREAAVADTEPFGLPEPLGADVVAVEKLRLPRVRD